MSTEQYANCRLCPRSCGVDRRASVTGFCGESAELRLAAASLHWGEEPPVTGRGGSGTIFVSGCNLGCVFCQNHQIAGGSRNAAGRGIGRPVSTDEFAAICLELQKRGAENINIVTGSHAVPALVEGIVASRKAGLTIPTLWNSSAYESPALLELLAGVIDRYLPDLKTLDTGLAARFFNAPDYPLVASAALPKMITACPEKIIIRHLILPGCLDSTRAVLRWFAENAQGRAHLSIMTQYTPIPGKRNVRAPNRFLDRREYETVLDWLEEFGIADGFCQELSPGSGWLPDFTRPNPFSSKLSVPVWNHIERFTIAHTQ